MTPWMLLFLMKLGNSQMYTCPYEEGTFYATSPNCVMYFRCETHMLWTGVCFPWQRFDMHAMSCRSVADVDCNPEYAGMWREVYGENSGTAETGTVESEKEEENEVGTDVSGTEMGANETDSGDNEYVMESQETESENDTADTEISDLGTAKNETDTEDDQDSTEDLELGMENNATEVGKSETESGSNEIESEENTLDTSDQSELVLNSTEASNETRTEDIVDNDNTEQEEDETGTEENEVPARDQETKIENLDKGVEDESTVDVSLDCRSNDGGSTKDCELLEVVKTVVEENERDVTEGQSTDKVHEEEQSKSVESSSTEDEAQFNDKVNKSDRLEDTAADTSIETKQEDSSGSYWYWCGSGRFVIVQGNQSGADLCLELPDPEFVNEEGTMQQNGDMAGHTFLGSDVGPM